MSTSAPPAPAGTTPGRADAPGPLPGPIPPDAAATPGGGGRPGVAAKLPEPLRPYLDEIETFYRVLPGLIADGEVGRYALVKDGGVHSVWDTIRDASQRGYELFEDGKFLRHKVDPAMLPHLRALFGDPEPAGGC